MVHKPLSEGKVLGAPPQDRSSESRLVNHRRNVEFLSIRTELCDRGPRGSPHPPMVGQRHVKASGSGCRFGPAHPQVHLPLCCAADKPSRARMPPSVHTPCALPAALLRWLCACCTASPAQPSVSSYHCQLRPLHARSELIFALLRMAEIPLNEHLSKNFGRCALQVVEDGACGAGSSESCPPRRARAHCTLLSFI